MGFVHLCVSVCKPSGLFGMWSNIRTHFGNCQQIKNVVLVSTMTAIPLDPAVFSLFEGWLTTTQYLVLVLMTIEIALVKAIPSLNKRF